MTRLQDQQRFVRNQRAAVLRVGTIAAVDADGKHMTVTVPEGTVTGAVVLAQVTTTAVGTRVQLLMDGETAVVVGTLK